MRRLWPIDEAHARFAELGLDVSRSRFYRLVQDGVIPSTRMGRIYVFDPEEIIERAKAAAEASKAGPVRPEAPPVTVPAEPRRRSSRRRFGG